jgi:Adenosyl cobinamide kinase/adenosyl cobinamide phosphate guanylyltransferase
MGKIILVTGGARSGKSSFAEAYAAKHGKNIAYIATAEIYDKEMKYRVALHKMRRPSSWKTYEAPYDAQQALLQAADDGHDMILFDCLTLYLSNMLCRRAAATELASQYAYVTERMEGLLQAGKKIDSDIVMVTNEVGAGIVPENALAREYRDLSGLANQLVAREAAAVYLVVCGIPVNIKKIAENLEG